MLQKKLVYIYRREVFSRKKKNKIEGGGIHGSKKEGQENSKEGGQENNKEKGNQEKEEVVLSFLCL